MGESVELDLLLYQVLEIQIFSFGGKRKISFGSLNQIGSATYGWIQNMICKWKDAK